MFLLEVSPELFILLWKVCEGDGLGPGEGVRELVLSAFIFVVDPLRWITLRRVAALGTRELVRGEDPEEETERGTEVSCVRPRSLDDSLMVDRDLSD